MYIPEVNRQSDKFIIISQPVLIIEGASAGRRLLKAITDNIKMKKLIIESANRKIPFDIYLSKKNNIYKKK
jgi:hypothetical protein